jgi:hypothetical protein
MGKPRKFDLHLRGKNINGEAMFLTPAIRKDWAKHFDNQEWVCTFKLVSSLNEKGKLFAFLCGPVLDCSLIAYEHAGVEFANTDDILYHFKKMFGKYVWLNPVTQKPENRLYDYSSDDVPADLLSKFLNDILLYMEQNFEFTPPDSEAYRTEKKLGRGFAPIKGKKFTDV